MPRFAATLTAAIEGKRDELTPAYLEEILKPTMENVSNSGSGTSLAQNWLQHMQESSGDEALFEATRLLCLAYLTHWRKRGGVLDPVASFHLSNGARLERINVNADPSAERQKESWGCMVNYLYVPDEVERNHELFVSGREIPMSKSLHKLYSTLHASPDNSGSDKNG
jgi:malonyl-CoA decarboxylase